MFKDDPNIIKLDEGIFWYKNFISKEEVELINSKTPGMDLGNHWFDEIEFKVTEAIPELVPVWNKVSEFLAPEYVIHPMASMLYFGEGAQMHPHCDSPIDVPVQPGDLVIHSALKSHEHGVRPVKSGTRYTFSNFSLKPEKNPGSFYNYGTPENEERQKELGMWLQPLFKNEQSVVLPELTKYEV